MEKTLETIEQALQSLNIPNERVQMLMRNITKQAVDVETAPQKQQIDATIEALEQSKKDRIDELTNGRIAKKQPKKNL